MFKDTNNFSLFKMKNSITHRIVYKSKVLRDFLGGCIWITQMLFLKFYKDPKIVDLINSVKKERDILMTPLDAFSLCSIVKMQSNLEGEMAEVGVYRGGSSKLICELKSDRKLHLFDTFEGLPQTSESDTISKNIYWKTAQFSGTSLESVKKYLEKYDNIFFYKGKFPDTAEHVKNSTFSFVHLDVDLYQSTLDCLQFFYPRLIKGGIILSHDYNADSVRKAFEDYFMKNKQQIFEIGGIQGMVIKN